MSILATPLQSQAESHIRTIQASLTILDASFAALKAELSTDTSAIKTFPALARKVQSIRIAFNRTHEKCFSGLLEISGACRDWQAVADYLDNGGKLPDGLDLQLIVAAHAARKAFVSGALSYSGADEIRQHVSHAQKGIEQHTARFRRIEGAGQVALARRSAEIYLAASISKRFPYRERKLCKSLASKCSTLQRARVARQRALVSVHRGKKV